MAQHDDNFSAEDLVTSAYDPAAFLDRKEAQAELLTEALESGDAAYVAHVLGVIARAQGMSKIARDAGVNREALYRSLSQNGNPELATIMAVAKALKLNLAAHAGV